MIKDTKFLMGMLLICFAFTACGGGGGDLSCTISFDGNGGIGDMASAEVDGGTDYTIPENEFMEPYGTLRKFAGWNTAANGSGTAYAAGDSVSVSGDIKLYAQWTKPLFSVSSEKKVYFSKGNLIAEIDASGSPVAWKFAANQYDCLGNGGANCTIGSSAGDMDLFGWSTDGNGTEPGYKKWGINASNNENCYKGSFVDWGKNVGDGRTWRTLTKYEWEYLLNVDSLTSGRTDACRFAKAYVNEKRGLIIFPDGYTGTKEGTGIAPVNDRGASFPDTGSSVDPEVWAAMENAGCVFLPAEGVRVGVSVTTPLTVGYYYSSTSAGATEAYYLDFGSTMNFEQIYRYHGGSVRLVCEE